MSETTATTIETKPEKKKFKIRAWMVVTASILIALGITALVLGLIPVNNFNASIFKDNFVSVNIYDSEGLLVSGVRNYHNDTDTNEIDRLFMRGIERTRHNLLRAVLEQNFVNALRLDTVQREGTEPAYDADGYPDMNVDGTRRMVNYRVRERNSLFVTNETPILNRTIYGSGIYVLDFRFAEQGQPRQEIRIRDHSDEGERFKTIQFDRIRIAINDSQNEIRQYMMWIYDTDYVLSGEAYVTPVLIRMNTTRLFENLNQIRYLRRGNDDNGEFIPPRPPGDDLPPDDDNGYDWD